MKVTTVDHLEFYVEDLARTVQLFCSGFGFRRLGQRGPETGLSDQRSVLLGQGGIRLLVTEGLSPQHPATRYVERHGDGVACLAMRAENPRDALLPGPGSLTHKLVAPPADDRALPPGFVTVPEDAGSPDELLETIDHLALCVPAGTLDATVREYEEVFGFRQIFEERVEVGAQAMDSKVVQSESTSVTLTIVSPDPSGQPGQLDDFLRGHGAAGVQHVAFGTS